MVLGSVFMVLVIGIMPSTTNTTQSTLERRVAELERRVSALEQQGRSGSEATSPASAGNGYRNIENWRQLKTGMTERQVEALLGRPERIDGGNVSFWHYSQSGGNGRVTFMDGSLYSWSEPR
jgi:hypothetical protein